MMLRRPTSGGRGPCRTTRTALYIALTVLASSLFLVECDLQEPFAEYRGVNLIEARGFTIDDFSEAYGDGSDPTATPYILLGAPASYGGTSGLPDTRAATLESIRSLEVINLMPNGDFEDGTTGPWILGLSDPGVESPEDFKIETNGELTGRYVEFDVDSEEGAAVDLENLSPIPVVQRGRYFLQFVAKRESPETTITMDYGDDETKSYNKLVGVSWVSEGLDGGSTPQVESFPDPSDPRRDLNTQFTITGTPNYLYLGSPDNNVEPQKGFLDDVRIGRLDNMAMRQLSVPVDDGTGLVLVPGKYTFSVYVKSEQDSDVTPLTGNRFRAGQIVLGANGRRRRIDIADGGWSQSQWAKVSTVVELSQEDIAARRPLRLQITTVATDRPVVGSILVARPELTLGTQAE